LGRIELEVIAARRSESEPCQGAPCLQEIADKLGVDLALTGNVFRSADLCTGTLWVYDRREAQARSAEIRCQPDSTDEMLAGEFADQAGRISEAVPAPAPQPTKQAEPEPSVTKEQVRPQTFRKTLWAWDWKRKGLAYGLSVSLAGLLVAAAG